MKIRKSLKKAEGRILIKEDKKFGILNYDVDNLYPQRMLKLINSAPTLKSCVETYARFIEGGGFKDKAFYKALFNLKGQAGDKILGLISTDLARFRGFVLHFNVTPGGKITETFHVPFEHGRLASDEKKTETGFDYAVYDDWGKQKKSSINPDNISWFNGFTTDVKLIQQNIKRAAEQGVEYKGMLLYFSLDEGSYPLASCDVMLESSLSEIQSDIFTTNSIENGFTKKSIFVHMGEFEEDEQGNSEERDEFEEGIEDFVGPEGDHVIIVEAASKEQIPSFVPVEGTVDDKTYQYTDTKILNKIIRNYRIPKILLSVTEGAGFFNQQQVSDAVEYYNLMTLKERQTVEAEFAKIGPVMLISLNSTNDYSIIPVEFKVKKTEPPLSMVTLLQDKTISPSAKRFTFMTFYGLDEEQAKQISPDVDPAANKRLLVDILGVGGVQALQNVLVDPALTRDQKKAALMIVFGIDDADAEKLVGVQTTTQTQQ